VSLRRDRLIVLHNGLLTSRNVPKVAVNRRTQHEAQRHRLGMRVVAFYTFNLLDRVSPINL